MNGMVKWEIRDNRLRGPIPHAVGSMTQLADLDAQANSFRGPIPHAVSSLLALNTFMLSDNGLRGPIPQAVGSLITLKALETNDNSLSGPIPHAVGSMIALKTLSAHHNSLRGPFPQAVGSLIVLTKLDVQHNWLHGPIPHAVSSLTALESLDVRHNRLCGPIPQAVGSMIALIDFIIASNSLSGTIPAALTWKAGVSCTLAAHDNQLSGVIPSGLVMRRYSQNLFCSVDRNRLTGTLPGLESVTGLTASGNLLEGRLPNTFNSKLKLLDVSGVLERSGGLIGPLPPALSRASQLHILALANQQMYGCIPSFKSTLSLLALHDNRLKVLPAILHFESNSLKTVILLHSNVLSCSVPWCDNATAKASIIAIGNRLRYPKGGFPAWVLEHEHDHILWVSGTDGMSLGMNLGGAFGMFIFVVASKLGSAKVLRAMSGS